MIRLLIQPLTLLGSIISHTNCVVSCDSVFFFQSLSLFLSSSFFPSTHVILSNRNFRLLGHIIPKHIFNIYLYIIGKVKASWWKCGKPKPSKWDGMSFFLVLDHMYSLQELSMIKYMRIIWVFAKISVSKR